MVNRINLVKFGFIRTPEEDFSDDGSTFTCYKVGRVRVSKCLYENTVYLAGRIKGNLPYNIYSKLNHYRAMDNLNGVPRDVLTEEVLKRFYDDCVAYDTEYAEAEKNYSYPTEEQLRERCIARKTFYANQLQQVEAILKDHVIDIVSQIDDNTYSFKLLSACYKTIKQRAEDYDPETYPKSILNTATSVNIMNDIKFIGETWCYDRIIKILEDVAKK